MKISYFFDIILDLIYPKNCVWCNIEGTWFCDKCIQKIVKIKTPFCPECQRITSMGQYCSNCRKKVNLTGVVIAAHYEKKCVLKEAVHTYKYDQIKSLKKDLSKFLIEALKARGFDKNLIIIPVPLSSIRLAQRGYNQSEELAKEILKLVDGQLITKKLIRTKHKTRQVDLPRNERIKNIKGVFDWRGSNEIVGKKVFIIDDIYTTGATLNECAKILRQKAGVKQVWGLVLGKG